MTLWNITKLQSGKMVVPEMHNTTTNKNNNKRKNAWPSTELLCHSLGALL